MAQTPPESEWITVKEMQRMLSLGRSKAYDILTQERDEIETIQIGRTLRVSRASLQRWLQHQRYPK